MRPSLYLTRALKAVEKVLEAETEDLGELAHIAAEASGIPAERILLRMDLDGLDLREHDIGYLVDKETRYHGAILTQHQRQTFERAYRKNEPRRTRLKIRSIRVGIISDFIDAYGEQSAPLIDTEGSKVLTAAHLRELMLVPLKTRLTGDTPLDAKYTTDVFIGMQPWVKKDNAAFFISLFTLIGKLLSPVDSAFLTVLEVSYYKKFGATLGTMIAQLPSTALLDCFWILGSGGEAVDSRAQQISEVRPVHPRAIEEALDRIGDIGDRMAFLEIIRFECTNDEAERIATRISRARWPASKTGTLLRTKTHPRVRSAIFRQLVGQGDERRVIEVLRWLDDNRGAVGALSLEDAFLNVRSFGVGMDFAEEVGSRFADNQLKVVHLALKDLADSAAEYQRLERFRVRMNYTAPASLPPPKTRPHF